MAASPSNTRAAWAFPSLTRSSLRRRFSAGVVSLWAASGVIKSLIEGFQAAYRALGPDGPRADHLIALARTDGADRLVLDLGRVRYVDSFGLGELVQALSAVRSPGRTKLPTDP